MNLNMSEADVIARCGKAGVAISAMEPLPRAARICLR